MDSCTDKKNEPSREEKLAEAARLDSMALHVAIYPSEVCMPFYYAEATGIYDSMDVDIRFLHLNAMEDCDTALMSNVVEIAATDIARLMEIQKNGQTFAAIATMNGHLRLMAAKGKAIKDIKQLKERLLAIERHSETDYLSDELTASRELEQLDVFRTQFNQHSIRFDMLNNTLIDAAFLDEPWATIAEYNGAVGMWKKDENEPSWNVLAANNVAQTDTSRVEQVKKLIQGYNLAVQALNKGELKEKYDSILVHTYKIQHEDIDSIEGLKLTTKSYRPLTASSDSIVNIAKQWLVRRQWIKPNQPAEQIITDKFIPRK